MSYPRPENFFLVRFLVVGAGRVGKTSIINRFVDKEFKEQTKTEKFVEYLSRYAYMNDNKDFIKALNRSTKVPDEEDKNMSLW